MLVSFTSCDSLLDMSPEDTMSPDTYFGSTKELKLWTDGFYSQLENADDVIGINADDNIDTELGATLLGQRSAADESGWNWDKLRSINTICRILIDARMKLVKRRTMAWLTL